MGLFLLAEEKGCYRVDNSVLTDTRTAGADTVCKAKAVISGVFSRSYCDYGNLLCLRNDNVFTNDWLALSYHDCSIN